MKTRFPMRRILLISFHFPPFALSSGVQRPLRFAQYLPDYGWEPIVLTVRPEAYGSGARPNANEAPPDCEVVRVPALNTAKHLSIAGRYPGALALPDRWASWQWLGPLVGRHLCKKRGISAVFSTYPIATAHAIAHSIAKSTGLPWVADFRDPMVQDGYPEDKNQHRAFQRIEEQTAASASAMLFTTPSATRTYAARYPDANCMLLENGYDESTFEGVTPSTGEKQNGRLVLLHSGVVYPHERNPEYLFQALAAIKLSDPLAHKSFVVRFRSPTFTPMLDKFADQYQVQDLIEICPTIPYQQALQEMVDADALLVLQADNCNEQIPAKLYEYLRANKPVLGLADPKGDTGRLLVKSGFPCVAALESAKDIENALAQMIKDLRSGTAFRPEQDKVKAYSRYAQTGQLAQLLDQIVQPASN